MGKVVRWVLIVALVAAAVGGYIWYRRRQAATTPPEVLRSTEIERGTLEIDVSASGNIAVNERTDLVIEAPGTVTNVSVQEGDRVETGETMATLSTDDLERSLRQAEIAVELADLSLETAKEPPDPEEIRLAELAVSSAAESLELARLGKQTAAVDANAAIVQAQRQREQAYIKLRDASGSKADDARVAYAEAEGEEQAARINAQVTVEQAESQYQSDYTAYERAVSALATLEEGPDSDTIQQREIQAEQAQLRLDQVRRSLVDSEIVAPHDGIVAAVSIDEAIYYSTGQPAFTVIDDSKTYVSVTIDEIDISAVAEGQSAIVVLDAYPEVELSGTVRTISPGPSDLGGIVAYRVRVELESDADVKILEGMTANVRVATEAIPDVLLLPAWAIRVDQETGEAYTFVVDDAGVASRTTIELGRRNETYSEVLSGLRAGDIVALVLEDREFTPPGHPSGASPFN